MLQDDPSEYTQSRIKSFFDRVQEATTTVNNNNLPVSFTKPTTTSSATAASVVKTLPHQPHHQLHQGHGLSPSSSILPNVVVSATTTSSTATKNTPSKNINNSKSTKSKEKISGVGKNKLHQNQNSSSTASLSDCECTTSDNFDPAIVSDQKDEKKSSNSGNNQPVHHHHQRRSESNIEFSSHNKNKKNVTQKRRNNNLSVEDDDNIQLLDQKAVCLATYPPAPQSKLLNQNNNNTNGNGYAHPHHQNQQKNMVTTSIRGESNNIQPRSVETTTTTTTFQLFKSGPIPLEVIQKHFANRKLKFMRRLGDKLYLAQKQQPQQQRINSSTTNTTTTTHNNNNNNGGDFICSYVLTIQDAMFANQLKEQYRTDSRHPGSVVVISAVKHSDGIVEVETEYCDVGPLERLYQYFSPNLLLCPPTSESSSSLPQGNSSSSSHYSATTTTTTITTLLHPLASFVAAKSIARQILLALHTFNLVHSRVHRGVSPRTILVRRDGTVKLGIFDAMVKADFAVSNSYPQEFWRSVYCAPECRYSTLFANNSDSNDTSSSMLQMMNTAVDNFFKISDSSKADMWSVGMVILSLILGETFFSSPSSSSSSSTTRNHTNSSTSNEESWKILEKLGLASSFAGSNGNRNNNNNNDETNNNLTTATAPSLPAENINSEKMFERVISKGTTMMNTYTSANFSQVDPTINELWAQLIPDAPLRYLTRRCLEVDPKKRISVSEATALTFIFGRTQGFRQKVFEELIGCVDKYCGVGENTSSDDDSASAQGEKKLALPQELIDAGLRWKNEQTETLPSWARYTECPFSMPDFIPSSLESDENDDEDDGEKEKKTKSSNQNQENNNNTNAIKEENSKTPIERQLTQEEIGNTAAPNNQPPQSQPQNLQQQQHLHTSSKKEEIVSLSDVIATSQISKLLGEETIAKETKLLSSLPSCCGGCVEDSPSAQSIISPAPSATSTPAVSPASSLNFNASLQFQQQFQQMQQQQFIPTSSFLSSPPSAKPSNLNFTSPVSLTGVLSVPPTAASATSINIATSANNTSSSPQSPSRFEDVNIQKYQRRVSTLLDLELQSQLTKRLNHPGGILSIEKQMREVMRSRVLPATKSLKAIVNEIAMLKKQEKAANTEVKTNSK